MNAERTAYEVECDRINRTHFPRWTARMAIADEANGWDPFCLAPEQEKARAKLLKEIVHEDDERIKKEIDAIPEDMMTEREILLYRREGPEHDAAVMEELLREGAEREAAARGRYLDRLACHLEVDGQNPAELDGLQVFLRAGFLGIDIYTRKELIEHLSKKNEVQA